MKLHVALIASKTFVAQCSFIDHLKYKIENKTSCRMPSTNHDQL